MCSLGGGCVFPEPPVAGRDTSCRVCNPALNPWGMSALPDGNGCNDNDGCTLSDRCSGGRCTGTCDDSRPECACEPE